MVAAGSVVAAVQGLNLGSPNNFLSYYRLTRFLSRVIKCDPVSEGNVPGSLAGAHRQETPSATEMPRLVQG